MATKREVIAQLGQEDLGLLAKAAEQGMKGFAPQLRKRVKRAVKILRTVSPSAAETKKGVKRAKQT